MGAGSVEVMFHPWRALRRLTHIDVLWEPQDDGIVATTNGTDKIWIDPRLKQVSRRCAVTHEMIHIEMGHVHGASEREESLVRAETARRLISIDQLLDVLRWAHTWEEAAEELWVTVDVFQDRLDGLSPIEREMISALAEKVERGA